MQDPRTFELGPHTMIVIFLDLKKSTEIAVALGESEWASFLQKFYDEVIFVVERYKEQGCRHYKFLGDGILLVFHLERPLETLTDYSKIANSAFEFIRSVQVTVKNWFAALYSYYWNRPLIQKLNKALHGQHLEIVASLAMGTVTVIDEPLRLAIMKPRRELVGVTIHLAHRLIKVHDLLPINNVFVDEECYNRLVDKNLFRNFTELIPDGFSEVKKVCSGNIFEQDTPLVSNQRLPNAAGRH